MSSPNKTLSAFLAFTPVALFVVYIVVFFLFFFNMIRNAEVLENSQSMPFVFFRDMMWIVIVAIIMGLVSLAALIYFIIHAVNNKSVESNERIIWILVFIFAGMIGFPIYWYMRIYKAESNTLEETR
jgi:H+/Cl- antiporter ClcA